MAVVKKTYIATTGLNLNCTAKNLQGDRVEAGEKIPDNTKPEVIKQLLADGDIKEDK